MFECRRGDSQITCLNVVGVTYRRLFEYLRGDSEYLRGDSQITCLNIVEVILYSYLCMNNGKMTDRCCLCGADGKIAYITLFPNF